MVTLSSAPILLHWCGVCNERGPIGKGVLGGYVRQLEILLSPVKDRKVALAPLVGVLAVHRWPW